MVEINIKKINISISKLICYLLKLKDNPELFDLHDEIFSDAIKIYQKTYKFLEKKGKKTSRVSIFLGILILFSAVADQMDEIEEWAALEQKKEKKDMMYL